MPDPFSATQLNGWGQDDFSLAWLVWVMGGFEWAKAWWTFKERGVGALTHALGAHFARDPGTDLRTGTRCRELRYDDRGVEAEVEAGGRSETMRAAAAVVAVPGCFVPDLLPRLDADRRRYFERVEYTGLHIAYWLVDDDKIPDEPSLLLPRVDGWERVTNLVVSPVEDGRSLVMVETKGAFCAATRGADAAVILDALWEEVVQAAPELESAKLEDRYLQRNDIGICRRHVGHIRRTADYRALGPLPRVAFAGDYLINTTVGQAHYSGLQAAQQLLARS